MAIPRPKSKSLHEEMKLLTQYIQIVKYAEKEGLKDPHDLFAEIQELTNKVREELYR